MGDGRFAKRCPAHGLLSPRLWAIGEFQSSLFVENHDLPGTDRRNPKFIARIVDRAEQTARKALRVGYAPQPNVRVQQELHLRAASHSSSVEIGPTMSPMISAVPAIEPI